MWPVIRAASSIGLQADALFASRLQRCDEPGADEIRQTVGTVVREFGYSAHIALVAQEFGDHPETVVIRMRWAHAVMDAAVAESALRPSPDGLPACRPRLLAGQAADSSGTGAVIGQFSILAGQCHDNNNQ